MAIFTTKYDLGDELYFLCNNKIRKGYVVGLYFNTERCSNGYQYTEEEYNLNSDEEIYTHTVKDLFRTEEELIQSLKS